MNKYVRQKSCAAHLQETELPSQNCVNYISEILNVSNKYKLNSIEYHSKYVVSLATIQYIYMYIYKMLAKQQEEKGKEETLGCP